MEFLHSMGAKQKTSHFPNPPGVHPSTALLSVAKSAKVTSKLNVDWDLDVFQK